MGPNLLGTVGSRGCGGNTPVLRDEDHVITHTCKTPVGGAKTVGVPEYHLTVTNLPDPNDLDQSTETDET